MIPILVFGAPRSGTTMLASMLGSCEGAVCLPEAQFLEEGLEKFGDGAAPTAEIVAFIRDHYRFKIWNFQPTDKWLSCLPQAARFIEVFEQLVLVYDGTEDKPVAWIEHSPSKIHHLERLAKTLPYAVFVHIVRDGRAVASSTLSLDWGHQDPISSAKHWVSLIEKADRFEKNFDGRYVVIRYEDILADDQAALKQLLALCGLKMTPAASGKPGLALPDYTKSQHQLVGSSPDKSRARAWEKNLSRRAVELFEFYAGPHLLRFGYQPLHDSPLGPTLIENIAYRSLGAAKRLVNKFRKAVRINRSIYLVDRKDR